MPITVVVRSASAPRSRTPSAHQENDPSLTFDGPRIVVGRGSGSDVRLPDPSVSFRHATIRAQGNDYVIVDESSSNGTWVGGVRLPPQTPRIIKNGELVRVGRVWLELAIGPKAPTPDLGLATRDLAFALVQRAMDALGDDTMPKVRVAEGPDIGEELRMTEEGRAYIIGRAETCDLPLADTDCSREHAVIARRAGQILIRDLNSRNGIFLGDQKLVAQRDVVWRSPTMARIGMTVLALDEPVNMALAELEAAADETMREDDAPPAPLSHAPSIRPLEEVPQSQMSPALSAPIAELATNTLDMPRVAQQKRVWTVTDIIVVTLALTIIGASLAGLVWVLR